MSRVTTDELREVLERVRLAFDALGSVVRDAMDAAMRDHEERDRARRRPSWEPPRYLDEELLRAPHYAEAVGPVDPGPAPAPSKPRQHPRRTAAFVGAGPGRRRWR